MTTDPNDGITDKQQYDAAVRDLAQFPHGIDPITAWMSGSVWARTHLAAQEPTDAEVRAAAFAVMRLDADRGLDGFTYSAIARAALSAARTARRDEAPR